jgi:chemotaxis protein histidine kinase CheA
MSENDFLFEVQELFLTESAELVEQMESCFLIMESEPDNEDNLQTIFRLAHNIKGSAAAVGFQGLSKFAHQIEDLLVRIKNREIPISPAVITLLLKSKDRLSEYIVKLSKEGSGSLDTEDLVEAIKALIDPVSSVPSQAVQETFEQHFDNSVLIVDDEEDIRVIFKARLSRYVSEVYVSSDGFGALSIIQNKHIDLVFIDIKMPDMDGITLFKKIIGISPDTLCIFISSHGNRENIKEALKFGAYDFMEKPIELELVDNCVARCLEKINYDRTQRQVLELPLYNYSDVEPKKFAQLSFAEKQKTLDGVLGLLKLRLLNRKLTTK